MSAEIPDETPKPSNPEPVPPLNESMGKIHEFMKRVLALAEKKGIPTKIVRWTKTEEEEEHPEDPYMQIISNKKNNSQWEALIIWEWPTETVREIYKLNKDGSLHHFEKRTPRNDRTSDYRDSAEVAETIDRQELRAEYLLNHPEEMVRRARALYDRMAEEEREMKGLEAIGASLANPEEAARLVKIFDLPYVKEKLVE